MANKVAVVTGANKGLGFAIVKGLATELDGTVYLTSRDEKRGTEACEELKKSGLNPTYRQLDVSDKESVAQFCDFIKKKHGQIDILINNAAVYPKDPKVPKLERAEQTINVNVFALIDLTEAMLPLIKEGGRIINISSSSGHLSRIPSDDLKKKFSAEDLSLDGLKALMNSYVESVRLGKDIEDGWGELAYVVSKNGVNAYTFMLHRRVEKKGITVVCVHPGYVMTDMTFGAGNVTAEQAARLIVELARTPGAGGRYLWHNGSQVPWDGPDPRGFIDHEDV